MTNIFPITLRYALRALARDDCQEVVTKLINNGIICEYSRAVGELEKGGIVEKVIINGNLCFKLSEFGRKLIINILKVVE